MLWKVTNENPLIMHDWSEVGVWDPMTDLGQTMISDVKREVWQKHDRNLIEKYWKRLIELGVSPVSFPFDLCWSLYQHNAVNRWIFFLLVLIPILPPNASQYFHDQMLAFIEDHDNAQSYPLQGVACIIEDPHKFFGLTD